jgi:Domain of unknown function (DUF4062)
VDKRYQVFVSSTYADLKEERQSIIQALIEMDCIPAGMELFPAADEEQFEFIKRIIDDCDYYIVIIGGRYGSTTPDGVSYTEKEYDYARGRGLKALAFIHENPDAIPMGKSELDPVLRGRLEAFREKCKTGKVIKPWTDAKELPGLVAISLQKTIKTYPAIGWVRANQVASADILNELNEVRKRNQELESQLNVLVPVVENIAGLDESVELFGTYLQNYESSTRKWSLKLTWAELFAFVAPDILSRPNDAIMEVKFEARVRDYFKQVKDVLYPNWKLNDQVFQTFKVQMMALKLANVSMEQTVNGGLALFWSLTSTGEATLLQLRSQKRTDKSVSTS